MKILTLLVLLLLIPISKAADCVAVVYEDETVLNVAWDQLERLRSDKRYLVVTVQQLSGGTTYKNQLTGHDIVYVRTILTSSGSVRAVIGGNIDASPDSATEHLFGLNGLQIPNISIPTQHALQAASGSDVKFYTYPYTEDDYDRKQTAALSADIGTC